MPQTDIMSIIKVFWQQQFSLKKPLKYLELNIRNTVFNTNNEEFPLQIIHFILLFTKYYICCKWSNHLPTIETLKCKLKSREKIEKINALLTDTITKHETNKMYSLDLCTALPRPRLLLHCGIHRYKRQTIKYTIHNGELNE